MVPEGQGCELEEDGIQRSTTFDAELSAQEWQELITEFESEFAGKFERGLLVAPTYEVNIDLLVANLNDARF
jgi:hypothetical protein